MREIAEQRKASGIISAITVSARPATPVARPAPSNSAAAVETDAEAESDAEVATAPRAETDAALADRNAGAPFDEDGPVWPSEEAEATEMALVAGQKGQGPAGAPRAAGSGGQTLRQAVAEAEAALGPLPSLDALIARIPTEARAAVEDLFRVKFTGVRRVSPEVLK